MGFCVMLYLLVFLFAYYFQIVHFVSVTIVGIKNSEPSSLWRGTFSEAGAPVGFAMSEFSYFRNLLCFIITTTARSLWHWLKTHDWWVQAMTFYHSVATPIMVQYLARHTLERTASRLWGWEREKKRERDTDCGKGYTRLGKEAAALESMIKWGC